MGCPGRSGCAVRTQRLSYDLELQVHTFVDVVSLAVSLTPFREVGNAELQPFEVISIDLSAEWYSGSAVSLVISEEVQWI